MKIELLSDDHLLIYYTFKLDFSKKDKESIKEFVTNLIVRLKTKYHVTLCGYYNLAIYFNKIMILDFERIDEYEDECDLSIHIYYNAPILVKMHDFFIIEGGDKIYFNGFYYQDIKDINLDKNIEFFEFVYGDSVKKILTSQS